MSTKFKVGDWVQFGNGTVPHEVVAVIATGRVITYDLVSQGELRKGWRHNGVIGDRLKVYKEVGYE